MCRGMESWRGEGLVSCVCVLLQGGQWGEEGGVRREETHQPAEGGVTLGDGRWGGDMLRGWAGEAI